MKYLNSKFLAIIVYCALALVSCKKSNNENIAPEIPHSPTPENNAINIDIFDTLFWESEEIDNGKIYYDVYFDTIATPGIVATNINSKEFIPESLNYNTGYYWKIIAKDDAGNTSKGPIWFFKTKEEVFGEIFNQYPKNNDTVVSLSNALRWHYSGSIDHEVKFDIYLDTLENPGLIANNITIDSFNTDNLHFNRTYYWKINAKVKSKLVAEGPLWKFYVQLEDCGNISNLTPLNNSINNDLSTNLNWNCTNNNNYPMQYDVYFGTNKSPDLVAENISNNSFNPGTLEDDETYFWKIVAKIDNVVLSSSEIMKFSTGEFIEYSFKLGNSDLNVDMIWIDTGRFFMGAQTGEQDAMGDEFPRHEVRILKEFWIGKYEVTQEQWTSIAGNWDFYFKHPNRPAEMVSWNDIHSVFLAAINEDTSNYYWRLPSEAEWEYVCRAGYDQTRFWWGNDPGYLEIDNYAWCWQNNGHITHEVGQKLPNPWGLYDMNGNVWEWCEDQYHNNYIGAPTDGSVWGSSNENGKVARGGGWGEYGAPFCRSSARGRDNPDYGTPIFGFRLILEEE